LAILDSLHLVEADKLSWWLAERQLPNGGLNGRPEKLPDVCYSWWVLSCLCMMRKESWIDGEKLKRYILVFVSSPPMTITNYFSFILSSQDEEKGGIADRPGDAVDVFHTLFGICGLSMLGYPGLEKVDPKYCMPLSVIKRMGL